MRIPINYGGSAFSEQESVGGEPSDNPSAEAELNDSGATAEEISSYNSDNNTAYDSTTTEERRDTPASILKNLTSGSFLGSRIGSEELLILALVFLLSDADADNDIIWLLLLLLFIK